MNTSISRMHMWRRSWRGPLLLIVGIAGSSAASEREDAFVGYSEDLTLSTSRARCQDKEDRCAVWQKDGQCLANPYYMRLSCAHSCQIPSCTGYQRSVSSWKGYATEFHTKQYANRLVIHLQVCSNYCEPASLRLSGQCTMTDVAKFGPEAGFPDSFRSMGQHPVTKNGPVVVAQDACKALSLCSYMASI